MLKYIFYFLYINQTIGSVSVLFFFYRRQFKRDKQEKKQQRREDMLTIHE